MFQSFPQYRQLRAWLPLPAAIPAYYKQNVDYVKGVQIFDMPQAPVLINGRTMLPARLVAEALGAEVSWSELLRRVTITKDDLTLSIYINRNYAEKNNEILSLDSSPFIENGRTYVPVRFIAEELGATVSWNADTREVTITRE